METSINTVTLDQVIARLHKLQADYRKFPDPTIWEYGIAWLLEDIERSSATGVKS